MHVNKTLKEIKAHGTRKLPLEVYEDDCRVYGAIYTHWHKEYEVIYIVDGKGELRINQKCYPLEKGDFILIGSEEVHYIESDKKEILTFQSIVFDHNILTERGESIHFPILKYVFKKDELPEFYSLFISLIQSYNNEEENYELLIKSDLYKMTYLLLKFKYISYVVTSERSSDVVMKEITDYINQHYNEDLKSEKLAEMAGYSKYHFTKVFKDFTGKTVVEYINQLRLNKSIDLLLNFDLTISEIAFELGYDNVSYFIKRFKTMTGKSPSQYKKEYQSCSIVK